LIDDWACHWLLSPGVRKFLTGDTCELRFPAFQEWFLIGKPSPDELGKIPDGLGRLAWRLGRNNVGVSGKTSGIPNPGIGGLHC